MQLSENYFSRAEHTLGLMSPNFQMCQEEHLDSGSFKMKLNPGLYFLSQREPLFWALHSTCQARGNLKSHPVRHLKSHSTGWVWKPRWAKPKLTSCRTQEHSLVNREFDWQQRQCPSLEYKWKSRRENKYFSQLNKTIGTSLAVQGLRLCTSTAGDTGSIPSQKTLLHTMQCDQKQKQHPHVVIAQKIQQDVQL